MARDLLSIPLFAGAFVYGNRNDFVATSLAVRLCYHRCCSGVSLMTPVLGIASTFEVGILDMWRPMVTMIFPISLPETKVIRISP